MWLAISLKATRTVEAKLELCILGVCMEVKNRYQGTHYCFADFHTELMDLFWIFFCGIGNSNAELQVGWVYYQLHREVIIHIEHNVVAITYMSVRLP